MNFIKRLLNFIAYTLTGIFMILVAAVTICVLMVLAIPVSLFCVLVLSWYILSPTQNEDEKRRAA